MTVQINTIGDLSCRKKYIEKLLEYFEPRKVDLPKEDRLRLKNNPLRILDSKSEEVKALLAEAPQITDYLCPDCLRHFKEVLEALDELEISYDLNPYLVRGLDYYSHTVFEVFGKESGPQSAIAGGGRFDYLVETLGGPKTPAAGFAFGLERLIHEMLIQNVEIPDMTLHPDVIVIQLGDAAKKLALKIEADLWREGIAATSAMGKESIRSQLKMANKNGIPCALILGQKEVLSGSIILRDMIDGVQETIALKKYLDVLKKKLGK
jgi:histidyl-tRNA synthetase